jgi:ClpP class serine protease
VDEVARGRVWVGKDARAKGLVDGLGGFAEALDDVRARVGDTAGELEPWVVTAPRVPGQRPTLPVPTSAALPPARAIGAQLVDRVLGPDLEAAALAATGERVLCLSPIAGRLARDP